MKKNTILLPFLTFLAASGFSHADVRLPAVFSDHMVLQRDTAVPVWGWADPGEQVTVSIAGQTQTATAGQDGKWTVKLNKLKAGDQLALTVKGKNTLKVEDVLVGDVWLGSGQSNMAMTVNRAKDYDQEMAAANFPKLRMFTVARNPQPKAQSDCQGKWEICSPDTVGAFSATAYFFGREVHQKLGVPVGLINSSYGGTSVEAWTSMAAQAKLPEYKMIAASWVAQTSVPWDQAKADAQYEKQLAAWKAKAKEAKAKGGKVARAPRKPVDPRLSQNYPANLYNGMIAPLIPYALKGAIWYQGENNANKGFAKLYGLQLATLIKDWRARWGYDFPFAWGQLPNFKKPQVEPVETTGWVLVREGMLNTLKLPHTGMAITVDIGEAGDIHPKNKQEAGQRLALWALGDVYHQKGVASSGPLLAGHQVRGKEIVLSFKHADGGLQAKDGELKGFAIAGADQKWHGAKARIDGDKVIVFSDDVAQPAAVRYAWADNPNCNLFNGAGIPAAPFRTDNWE